MISLSDMSQWIVRQRIAELSAGRDQLFERAPFRRLGDRHFQRNTVLQASSKEAPRAVKARRVSVIAALEPAIRSSCSRFASRQVFPTISGHGSRPQYRR